MNPILFLGFFFASSALASENAGAGISASPDRGALEDFLRHHPDRAKWSSAEEDTYALLQRPGGVALAARRNAAGANADCPYAGENLAYAVPGAWKENRPRWGENGRVSFPPDDSVVSQRTEGDHQLVVSKGGGVLFARNARPGAKTELDLTYDQGGHLTRLKIGTATAYQQWSATFDYGNPGAGCRLERITVATPELAGRRGISFDRALCAALGQAGLLDAHRARTAADFEARGREVWGQASAKLSPEETYVLFTSAPDGSTKLWQEPAKAYPGASAALAGACLAAGATGQAVEEKPETEDGITAPAP